MHRVSLFALGLVLTLGCDRSASEKQEGATEPSPKPATAAAAPQAPPAEPAEVPSVAAGGLTWDAPNGFTAVPPSSRMRAAQYRVGEGATAGELTVYHFPGTGGSVEANVERWVEQFAQPDGSPSKDAASIDALEVHGLTVTTVDVKGTYTPMSMPGAPPSGPKADYRLLGAIADGPAGPVFFKLTGPSATLGAEKPAFDALVKSVRPKG